jgi:hypothetical protein
MAYSVPPSYALVGLNVTNVAGNTTIIGAPGVGFTLRILGFHATLRQSVAAGIVDLIFQDGAGGTGIFALNIDVTSHRTVYYTIPEPGIQLTANNPLSIQRIASVAGPLSIAVGALYFTDDVS